MADSQDDSILKITVEFTGGLELLFSNQRKHSLSLPETCVNGRRIDIKYLVSFLCENTMKDGRRELFVLDQSVRPGILVLINDTDWELEGGDSYELQDRDNILFVSTLHGG